MLLNNKKWVLSARSLFTALYILLSSVSEAQCPGNHSTPISDAGKRALPIVMSVLSLAKKDWVALVIGYPLVQLLYTTNSRLEKIIPKKRPCGCYGAFPSGHTILMSGSASFIYARYGPKYGIPLFIGFLFLIIDRVQAQAHSWFDVLLTALLYHIVIYLVVVRRGGRWRDKWKFLKRT